MSSNFITWIGVTLIFLSGALYISCSSPRDANPHLITYKVSDVTIRILDGCEYIVNDVHLSRPVLTHKGNCLNSIHIYSDTSKKPVEKATNNIGQARDVIIGGH